MDVILLDKIENLGGLGDIVSVKAGYGRNFLIPKGRAVLANAENRERFEQRRAELEQTMADALAAAERRREALLELQDVTISHRAGDEGKLFGSVGTVDIADALTAAGVEVRKQEVRLPHGAFRETGEQDVEIHLHPEVNVTVRINIVSE